MEGMFNLRNEDELIEALKHGAVVIIGPDGAQLAAHDDLPADMRECIRINRAVDRIPRRNAVLDTSTPEAKAIWNAMVDHRAECPSCLESEADSCLMDAAWWREEATREPAPRDGQPVSREQIALELEAEAAELNAKAARIRAAQEAVRGRCLPPS
jgi:hypothetical protein